MRCPVTAVKCHEIGMEERGCTLQPSAAGSLQRLALPLGALNNWLLPREPSWQRPPLPSWPPFPPHASCAAPPSQPPGSPENNRQDSYIHRLLSLHFLPNQHIFRASNVAHGHEVQSTACKLRASEHQNGSDEGEIQWE